MDIALLRGDEVALHRLLPDWEFDAIHDGTFVLWDGRAPLQGPHHQFWLRRDADCPWDFEILLEDHDDRDWLFRRNHQVTRLLEQLGGRTADGIPHVALEVALLYKAKGHDVERNARDFDVAQPSLDGRQRSWLAQAIVMTHPEHPWLGRLR